MLSSGPGTRRSYKYIVVAIVSILLININMKNATPFGDSAVLGTGEGMQSSTQITQRSTQAFLYKEVTTTVGRRDCVACGFVRVVGGGDSRSRSSITSFVMTPS